MNGTISGPRLRPTTIQRPPRYVADLSLEQISKITVALQYSRDAGSAEKWARLPLYRQKQYLDDIKKILAPFRPATTL